MYDIILASKSPRRSELLNQIGIKFKVLVSEKEEIVTSNIPSDVVMELSLQKALDVKEMYEASEHDDKYIIIGADTVVAIDDKILGKPKDADDARRMLCMISGKKHSVVTGVTIMTKEKSKTFSVTSKVSFDVLDEDEINYYVNNYKPMDKAGSYGVQEWIGYIGVNYVEGSYFNVMGLPTQKLYQMLKCF